ncbi:MAG: leucine-rich repeat domain-containing protein, partial [Kiritimatiellia bacterium]
EIDRTAETGAFGNCGNLETVEFGPNLETIGHHAFSECGHLKSLTIPDSVTTIGVNCFYNNIRLTKVTFGADLQSIGACAFMGCVSLSSVSFSPATTPLLTINANAFANCKYLASLTLSNAMPTIKSGAFAGCTMLRRITVPSLMSTIESNVFSGMENLNEVIFLGLPPENLANAGLATDIKIRYPEEYKEDWEAVVQTIGFTNASVYEQKELPGLIDDSRYGLSDTPGDRSIASVSISENSALDEFVLENGKVFDCIIRIVNTAANDVTVTLPAGYTYESFKSATPLVIPANSRNILTITRTSETTFLVTREELAVLQQ